MTKETNASHAAPEAGFASDALAAAIAAAFHAERLVAGNDGRQHLLVPEGFGLHDITDPQRLPARVAETVIIDERDSLSNYVNRFKTSASVLIADHDSNAIAAIIDWHEGSADSKPAAPGGTEHSAVFKLRPSEEYRRWDAIEGSFLPQDEFAAFLEENVVDVVHPESGSLLEIARDLEATQTIGYKSSTRLENGDRTFHYESDTQTKGSVTVPSKFTLSIPLYQGEEPIEIEAAFRWRATQAGVVFGFQWRRVEYLRLAHFRQIATKVVEDTGLPVFYGRRG